MKPTISDLWNGNIHPIEEITENESEEREILSVIEEYYEKLSQKLDDSGKQMLYELRDKHTSLSFVENESTFIQGFSLAVKLMTEAMAN